VQVTLADEAISCHVADLSGEEPDLFYAQEPSTCHYVMTVQTPRLCNHPGFNVFKPQVSHILCRIEDGDTEVCSRCVASVGDNACELL